MLKRALLPAKKKVLSWLTSLMLLLSLSLAAPPGRGSNGRRQHCGRRQPGPRGEGSEEGEGGQPEESGRGVDGEQQHASKEEREERFAASCEQQSHMAEHKV